MEEGKKTRERRKEGIEKGKGERERMENKEEERGEGWNGENEA